MEKRFIGIDIDGCTLRVAIASPNKGRPVLVKVAKTRLNAADELPAALAGIIGATRLFGDRLVAALPASSACYRWMRFPFSDSKRLAAAGRLNLGSQLPFNMDDCVLGFQPPITEQQGTITAMAAVPKDRIATFLESFDQSETPLHLLDLVPFAVSQGLSGTLQDVLILLLREEESVVCLLRNGHLADCRLLPAIPAGDADRQASRLARIGTGLCARAASGDLPLMVMGSGATDEIVAALRQQGANIPTLQWACQGTLLAPEFLPAAALAIRASLPDRQGRLNLRQGEFALQGEWAALKRKLTAGGVLLTLCLGLLTGTAWLYHAHKSETVSRLQKEIRRVYRQTFPDDKMTKDLHRQMLGRLNRMKEEGQRLGLFQNHSALEILRVISDAPPGAIRLDTRELLYDEERVTLEGTTDTFDSVNQLARALEQTAMFEQAQVTDAKQNADGSRIDFRLQLTLQRKETS